MDFVVVGFGLGALIVLAGLGVRIFGPPRRPVERARPLGAAELVDAVAWGRGCRGGGLAVGIGGALLLLATLVAVVGQAGDDTGDLVVLTAGCVVVGLVVLWAIVYLNWQRLRPPVERWGARIGARLTIAAARRDQRRRAHRQARPRARADASHGNHHQQPPDELDSDLRPGWLPPLPIDDAPLDDDWVPSLPSAASNGRRHGNGTGRSVAASSARNRK